MLAKKIAGKDPYVRPGHLLLGIIQVENTVATTLLESCGVNVGLLVVATEKHLADTEYASNQESVERVEYSAMSLAISRAISASIEEAKALRHNYVGTEHLMLALLKTRPDGIFADNDIYEDAIVQIKSLLDMPEEAEAPELLSTEESLIIADEVHARVVASMENMVQLKLWIEGLQRSIAKHNTLLREVQGVLALDEPAEAQIEKIKSIMDSM